MKSLLIQLPDSTYRALNKVAPPAKRRRSKFVREAIEKAILDLEYEQIRKAYEAQPDSQEEWTDWTVFGEYKP